MQIPLLHQSQAGLKSPQVGRPNLTKVSPLHVWPTCSNIQQQGPTFRRVDREGKYEKLVCRDISDNLKIDFIQTELNLNNPLLLAAKDSLCEGQAPNK